MKAFYLFIFGLLPALVVRGQANWAEDIAPILYKNCTGCHNPSGVAPFSLMTHQDAQLHAPDIGFAVQMHEMPPWPPDASYRHFAHERLLTQAEIDTIVNWVNNGSPLGDTTLAPVPPVYSGVAEITSPDLVTQMPNYTVDSTVDLYRCFVMPTGLATQQFITEIEGLPGNRNIVHHILIFQDTSGVPAHLDSLDPGPGYTNYGGTGSNSSELIGTWVPGQGAYRLPAGMGLRLPAHTNIVIQVHYPAGSFGQVDSTQIRFKLVSGPLREVAISPLLNHWALDNGPLFIPADSIRTFDAHFNVPNINVSFLSVGPHMHLIGKSIVSYGITPLNDTIPLIRIPQWDFHWQGLYSYQYVQKIPANTVLYSHALYDNTSANPMNPNNPPHDVSLGEATTDEMMLIFFSYTVYLPGDENILIDSSLITGTDDPAFAGIISSLQLYEPFPNPAQENLYYQFYAADKASVETAIYDLSGRCVLLRRENGIHIGVNNASLPLNNLAKGSYVLRLRQGTIVRSKPFLKTD